jgi:putative tricarboxylic transport membrane protein
MEEKMLRRNSLLSSIIISLFVMGILSGSICFAASSGWQPKKRIEWAVHCSPGCGNDIVARGMTKALRASNLAPVPIQVINHAGGGGEVQRAWLNEHKGNHYILSSFSPSWLSVPLKTGSGNTWDRYTPIANLLVDYNVIVVSGDSPYKNLKDYLQAAKEKPGKVTLAGTIYGGNELYVKYLLERTSGAKIKFMAMGDQVVPQVLGGHIDAMSANPAEVMHLKEPGKVRFIAVLSDERVDTFPNVPTAKEQGYDVELYSFRAVTAPGDIPNEVSQYYSQLLKKGTETKEWKDFVKNMGTSEKFMERGEFKSYVSKQAEELHQFMEEYDLIKKKK